MPQFILLIREDLTRYPIPQSELNTIVSAHVQWAKELAQQGIFVDGNGIASQGKLLSLQGNTVQAGPIADAKQGIGGYYIINAPDIDAAVEIAKQMPTFHLGDMVEVRPLGT